MTSLEASPQLSGREEMKRRKDSTRSLAISDGKRGSAGSNQEGESSTPKVNKKFINNWKHACDRTKDRTKELLKKWRTLPEPDTDNESANEEEKVETTGWTEHVWTTWVKRCPSGEGSQDSGPSTIDLTPVQKEKFGQFFVQLLDMDSDDVISLCDFENLFEKFRHYADWSKNSAEYHRLLEVQRGFVEYFLLPPELAETSLSYEGLTKAVRKQQLELDEWLAKWSTLLADTRNFLALPLWLQYFPVILFQVIDKNCSGSISQSELASFYSSVIGLSEQQINGSIKKVYKILTGNGSCKLDAHAYRLSFANFVLGRFPNGPGQYLLYPIVTEDSVFPIDYKALSCAPRDLETYSPEVKTNRRSVIV